jgi:fructose-1,6-bisphosphatase
MDFNQFSKNIIDSLSSIAYYSEIPLEKLRESINSKLDQIYKSEIERAEFILELRISKGEVISSYEYDKVFNDIKKEFLKKYDEIARIS